MQHTDIKSKTFPPPICWTIAASDNTGGAGIQADLLTFQHLKCHGASILTASTAQNHLGVKELYPLPLSHLQAQWDTLFEVLPPQAIKMGVIGHIEHLHWLIEKLTTIQPLNIPIIYDPVLKATAGGIFISEDWREIILKKLCPLITLITPNFTEANWLANFSKTDEVDKGCAEKSFEPSYQTLAEYLHHHGVKHVIITGGDTNHLPMKLTSKYSEKNSSGLAADYYSFGKALTLGDEKNASEKNLHPQTPLKTIADIQGFWLLSPRSENGPRHGTGCVFASAIAASLASGYDIRESLVIAKSYINQGLRTARDFRLKKISPIQHQYWERNARDWPKVISAGACSMRHPLLSSPKAIKPADESPLPLSPHFNAPPHPIGIYPLIDNLATLQLLLDLGITTLQLRIKNRTLTETSDLIKAAVKIAATYSAKLYINDYWELALEHGAYGVHLGQEDLMTISPPSLENLENPTLFTASLSRSSAPLHLGISVRNYWELAKARFFQPDYLGVGPIFPTATKAITTPPLGITQLQEWCRFSDYPIVAIGGIQIAHIPMLKKTGITGVAMISGLMNEPDLKKAVKKALVLWDTVHYDASTSYL